MTNPHIVAMLMSMLSAYCLLQLYVLTLSLVRIDVGALVSSSMSVYPLLTLLLIRTGGLDQCC